MTKNWKKSFTSVVITAALMTTGASALAADAPSAITAPSAVSYKLTDLLDVEVKSVLSEKVADGNRLGVVVRMKNNSAKIHRVPEYELRVKTSDGVEYTLQSSAANAKSIQPKATSELSYMAVIDRTDEVTLTEVNWTDVDYYVYPKAETVLLAVPVESRPWSGSDTPITDPAAVKKWSDSFAIPSVTSPLTYKPMNINKESTDKGTVYVVQLLVSNATDKREAIPAFLLEGKTESKVFSGNRVEQGELYLEAGEEKYIHYAIPTDLDTMLASLNLLTPESFVQVGPDGKPAPVNYTVGRLNILLPTEQAGEAYTAYELGKPMNFDTLSKLIHPDLAVSVVEFHMNENDTDGSKDVTAKFMLTNKSDRPLSVPVFQTELISADGYIYSGNRQSITTQRVLPNSSLVLNYSYVLPNSETGEGLALKVVDTISAAPYKTPLATYGMTLQPQGEGETFTVFPFEAKVKYWTIAVNWGQATNYKFTYKARFDLELKRQEMVQLDNSFSRIQLDLLAENDRLIGSTQVGLVGPNHLVSGENNILFSSSSEQLERPLTIKMYEVFTTPAGESKRLIGSYKQ
ncbi:hypothetical protein RAC89_21880 [Paenibacillus sp. GD4]|uniref:hypothetical protein n=1 Tax=Paenibacillus sp. GD4 TaxID=3068890 RepID=UPI0027969BC1|nr:hypothetical protein [Paenibacillus sp. GD4]MDQ1913050.1 hypothetical protein [Paenibacillus sp. GD4]